MALFYGQQPYSPLKRYSTMGTFPYSSALQRLQQFSGLQGMQPQLNINQLASTQPLADYTSRLANLQSQITALGQRPSYTSQLATKKPITTTYTQPGISGEAKGMGMTPGALATAGQAAQITGQLANIPALTGSTGLAGTLGSASVVASLPAAFYLGSELLRSLGPPETFSTEVGKIAHEMGLFKFGARAERLPVSLEEQIKTLPLPMPIVDQKMERMAIERFAPQLIPLYDYGLSLTESSVGNRPAGTFPIAIKREIERQFQQYKNNMLISYGYEPTAELYSIEKKGKSRQYKKEFI